MTPLERADGIVAESAALLQDIKDGFNEITLAEAHQLHSRIVESRGWLDSSLKLLEPPNVL